MNSSNKFVSVLLCFTIACAILTTPTSAVERLNQVSDNYQPLTSNSVSTYSSTLPYGTLDVVDTYQIGGWAYQNDYPDTPINVHIYIINNSTGETSIIGVMASGWRQDLYNGGFGNGYHGFSYAIDWSTLPKEELKVTAYAVDQTGYHPAFFDGYYDNRLAITLLGMVESKYYHDFSKWIWLPEVETYCKNIGCSELERQNCATVKSVARNYAYENFIKQSSYCSITTHGKSDGKSIEWSMHSYFGDPEPWQEYGFWHVDQIDALPSGYFSKTRCVVLMACCAGLGGDSNPDNMVNALHRKGVKTVVGFKNEVYYT